MSRTRQSPRSLIMAALWPALALLIIGNFAGYALLGANGLFALGDYRQQLGRRAVELKQLEAQRAQLAHRVALLDPRRADPDMADELVRKDLGLARPDEVILDIK
ncbi:FtsB family cell division protein [Sphingomonas quercus]|uniref:Septum formation initiator family protein n=1 Tax=Sphingomonas quercus TaxID=2842451 RepID=A0ABS6BDZ7_9SPHN|nr:septum formation initiator family protein [Sphingomonas quercus]MBU3076384.1 septum formation initiator family protein [Sphingomonas quercus]